MSSRTAAALLLAACAAAMAGDAPTAGHERLFRDLGAETESVREAAGRALEKAESLSEDEARAALASARPVAKVRLLRVVAMRGMKGLVPDVVAALVDTTPDVADAAARALVGLGDDAVAAGLARLSDAKDADPDIRVRLEALIAQRTVERELIAKWRRKQGSYEGRYKELERHGWKAQPILLAMLLDIPLEPAFIVLPPTETPDQLLAARQDAIRRLLRSKRRGYRTFDTLPIQVEPDDLFSFACQALKDVGDMDLIGDGLEQVAGELEAVDKAAGWRLRRFEEGLYQAIDEILFKRGRPKRLLELERELRDEVRRARHWADVDDSPAQSQTFLSRALNDHAQVLHQVNQFDKAAAEFAEVMAISKRGGGKENAIASYNRACSLARGGRKEEALKQLRRSLDRNISSGSEDLTREWVTEDGDLASLHDDPEFARIIKERYDVPQQPRKGADGGGAGGGEKK